MNVLIVHAHPGENSFNAAMKNTAVKTLTANGHEVQVSDLYAMKLLSPPTANDYTGDLRTAGSLTIDIEQEHQFEHGGFAADIVAEQEKVEWCDVLIFQFPVWWFAMPSILKAWVERIMARGYAYGGGRKHDKGVFIGRKAMVSCTTGTPASTYAADGVEGHIQNLLWPVNNGIFHYLGFTPLPPFVAFAPRNLSQPERTQVLEAYAARLHNIENTQALFMHPRSDYQDSQRLLPDVHPRSGFQWQPGRDRAPGASDDGAVPCLADNQLFLS